MKGNFAVSLRFEHDNPYNTTIVDHKGNTFYTVTTKTPTFLKPFRKRVTRVHDGVGNIVAKWKWRNARSDLLTIRDRPQTSASAWLKKSLIPFRDDVTFLDDVGTKYVWKKSKPGLSLQLFGPQSKTRPVARLIRAHKNYKINRKKPPVVHSTLLLDKSVEPIYDLIVVSFLLLERRRLKNKNEKKASVNFAYTQALTQTQVAASQAGASIS